MGVARSDRQGLPLSSDEHIPANQQGLPTNTAEADDSAFQTTQQLQRLRVSEDSTTQLQMSQSQQHFLASADAEQGGESSESRPESDADGGRRRTHYFVDVPHPEESTYDATEQNVQIDPALRAQLQVEHDEDISHFLALPEIIPAKKRTRQQPLLDFTHSRILTSHDYMTAMEQVLSQREATAAEAKRKKTEKEATREQRKAAQEQLQIERRERAEARAVAKAKKDSEKRERVAAKDLERQERMEAAAGDQRQHRVGGCISDGGSLDTQSPAAGISSHQGLWSASEASGAGFEGMQIDQQPEATWGYNVGAPSAAGQITSHARFPSAPSSSSHLPVFTPPSHLPFAMPGGMMPPSLVENNHIYAPCASSGQPNFYSLFRPPPSHNSAYDRRFGDTVAWRPS